MVSALQPPSLLAKRVITNDPDTLLASLQTSFRQAVEIKLVVSFILESGVRLLLRIYGALRPEAFPFAS